MCNCTFPRTIEVTHRQPLSPGRMAITATRSCKSIPSLPHQFWGCTHSAKVRGSAAKLNTKKNSAQFLVSLVFSYSALAASFESVFILFSAQKPVSCRMLRVKRMKSEQNQDLELASNQQINLFAGSTFHHKLATSHVKWFSGGAWPLQ